MDRRLYVIVSDNWLMRPEQRKLLETKELLPLGTSAGHLEEGCSLLVKLRTKRGTVVYDVDVRLARQKQCLALRSKAISESVLRSLQPGQFRLVYLEGSARQARCVVRAAEPSLFVDLEQANPDLRLAVFDVPPTTTTVVEEGRLIEALYRVDAAADPELHAVHTSSFLGAPHILIPLFEHVLRLSSDEHIDFPIQLRKLAEQLRILLADPRSPVRIEKVQRDHRGLWYEVSGSQIAFLDGGAARIAGIPNTEPLALRVGVYSVRPGETDPDIREQWHLWPYVTGDLLDRSGLPQPEHPEDDLATRRKRLQEASRYLLEPLTGLRYLRDHSEAVALFMHGPLVNQFTMYDEGDPNFLPCLSARFLKECGVSREEVQKHVKYVPETPSGKSLWNQFMALYGYVMGRLDAASIPVIGVVERTAGRWLARAVLAELESSGVIVSKYANRVLSELERYDISDDFLFGCVLKDGEYLTPVPIVKSLPKRAREKWQLVVQQYPHPYTTILKTSDVAFPYRIELNQAARKQSAFIVRLLYHTSRLLPQYAFPVGLDIVDKLAKVPDWLSRGISAHLSADVLRRALRTGDPVLVEQIRRFLARRPRDFFFRPQAI